MSITISGNGITSANILDGTITNADVNDVAASKLTGTLPAIDGSALTGISGGKILQVVNTNITAISSYAAANDTWYDVTGLTATITPSATSSKILVMVALGVGTNPHNQGVLMKVLRDSSEIDFRGDTSSNRSRVITGNEDNNHIYGLNPLNTAFVDSPSATSALVYKVQIRVESSSYGAVYVNRAGSATDTSDLPAGASAITLLEIGA